jgi:hypothetical protein
VGFSFLFSLHHPNNRLENIFNFYLLLRNSAEKTPFLGRKYIGGASSPTATPTLQRRSVDTAVQKNLAPLNMKVVGVQCE